MNYQNQLFVFKNIKFLALFSFFSFIGCTSDKESNSIIEGKSNTKIQRGAIIDQLHQNKTNAMLLNRKIAAASLVEKSLKNISRASKDHLRELYWNASTSWYKPEIFGYYAMRIVAESKVDFTGSLEIIATPIDFKNLGVHELNAYETFTDKEIAVLRKESRIALTSAITTLKNIIPDDTSKFSEQLINAIVTNLSENRLNELLPLESNYYSNSFRWTRIKMKDSSKFQGLKVPLPDSLTDMVYKKAVDYEDSIRRNSTILGRISNAYAKSRKEKQSESNQLDTSVNKYQSTFGPIPRQGISIEQSVRRAAVKAKK